MATASTAVAASLVIGSLATLLPRVLLLTPCGAGDGDDALHAPVFAGAAAFTANALGLLIQAATERRCACARARSYGAILFPGALATAGTLLQLGALLFIPAATLAGLRGAFIVFVAIISSRWALRDAPRSRPEWACVLASGMGAALVGVASAVADNSSDEEGGGAGGSPSALVGVALSLAGYAIAAVQVGVEQVALDALSFTRWEVLGVEGGVGLLACAILLAALGQPTAVGRGSLDDPAHTLRCLAATPAIPALAVAYGVSSLSFNALQLLLAAWVGPNLRAFVFTARGLLTWGVELGMGAVGGSVGAYGERLTRWAALEAVGWLLLLVAGVARARMVGVAPVVVGKEVVVEGSEGVDEPLLEGGDEASGSGNTVYPSR